MFGTDSSSPPPPPLPDPLPATPMYASGAGKNNVKAGKPYGGTLLTKPGDNMPEAPVARRSLLGA